MKPWCSRLGRWLIALVSAVLLVWGGTLLSDWVAYMNSPPMWAKSFMMQGAESLTRLAANQGGDDGAHFDYPGTIDAETYIFIRYIPEDKFPFQETVGYPEEWHPALSSEDGWFWVGGMNGKGYLDVKRLRPKWFYVEYFNPT